MPASRKRRRRSIDWAREREPGCSPTSNRPGHDPVRRVDGPGRGPVGSSAGFGRLRRHCLHDKATGCGCPCGCERLGPNSPGGAIRAETAGSPQIGGCDHSRDRIRAQAEPRTGPPSADLRRPGVDDRQRHFRAHRHRRRPAHRPGRHPRLPRGRDRLRPGGPLLRRAGLDDPDLGQRLQLHVRDARRRRRLVRRLEPRARIRDVGRGRRGRLVRLRRQPARRVRPPPARRAHQRAAGQGPRQSPGGDGRTGQRAGRAHRRAADVGLLRRREAVDARQQRDGDHQDPDHHPVHRGRHQVRLARPLAALPAREYRQLGTVRLQRHHAGRRDHLLRLHRLRPGRDDGAGSPQPAARRAVGHHRRAAHLRRRCTS